LGTRYFGFLARENSPISIVVKCTALPDLIVEPRDILYLADAKTGFDKDAYDGKTPCKVFDDEFPVTAKASDPKAKLKVVLFPKREMASNSSFTTEERDRIKAYEVGSANKGFFVYRNGRLVRWGDDLDGLIPRELLGFRARLDLETAHDDVFHVDVSKQHLSIPEEILEKIDLLTRIARRDHKELFNKCNELSPKTEGGAFNEQNDTLADEDPDDTGVAPSPEQKKRKKALVEETTTTLKEAGEATVPPPGPVTELPKFEKVRYSDKVASAFAWEAGSDPAQGTFVRINKNHSFYVSYLSLLDANGPERQSLEAIFWALAVAEVLTISNLASVDDATIRTVVDKLKRVFASNLDNWASSNQSLLTNA